MEIEYRLATEKDINTLVDFYNDIVDYQTYDEYGACWTKDIYPCKADLENHIKNNKFYLGYLNNVLVCAGALQLHEDSIYSEVNFKIKENVGVIHLIAVSKDYRHQGISKEFVNYIINQAKPYVKAIHLDVITSNLRACRLYESCGFKYIETKEVFYEDTGNISANLYEYIY